MDWLQTFFSTDFWMVLSSIRHDNVLQSNKAFLKFPWVLFKNEFVYGENGPFSIFKSAERGKKATNTGVNILPFNLYFIREKFPQK